VRQTTIRRTFVALPEPLVATAGTMRPRGQSLDLPYHCFHGEREGMQANALRRYVCFIPFRLLQS
jgi:hypothetical protein